MVDVMLQLDDHAARSLQPEKTPTAEADSVRQLVQGMGLKLEPLHPGSPDSSLYRHFRVQVPDPDTAARIARRLNSSPVVQAAYVQPPDAAPLA